MTPAGGDRGDFSPGPSLRAFVAVEVPAATIEGATAVQARLKSAGVEAGWSRPAGMHLTLKFLGEVPEGLVPKILEALALGVSGKERFRLCAAGVGAFPNQASARVVWLGVAGDVERLAELQAAVEQALAAVGLQRDERPYTPHLTLGRIKRIGKRTAWLKELEGLRAFRLPEFEVASVRLIRSELRPAGAVYRELGSVTLKEAPGRAAPTTGGTPQLLRC